MQSIWKMSHCVLMFVLFYRSGAGSRLFSRSLQLLGMCKDKQRGNYERGCFDIMSISLNCLLRFDAKVRVCVKKLRKKQYASWILLYFGHAARGRGKKNIIFEFLCFDLDFVLVPLRKQKMEKLKAVKKRAPKWSEAEINALVNAVESQRRQILGSFSSDITSSTKTQAWKLVTSKVSEYVRVIIVTSCRLLGYSFLGWNIV